jgi:hypothetical protein
MAREVNNNTNEMRRCNKLGGQTINDVNGSLDTETCSTKLNDDRSKDKRLE